MIPNTSKYAPPVSQYIPLINAIPPRTLSRRLGVQPSWPKTEAIAHRVGRAPAEVGLVHFLFWLLTLPATWPFLPAKAVAFVAGSLEQQAEKDQDTERRLEQERLSLEMTREMGEISEDDFKKRLREIEQRLEEIKGPSK